MSEALQQIINEQLNKSHFAMMGHLCFFSLIVFFLMFIMFVCTSLCCFCDFWLLSPEINHILRVVVDGITDLE